jgi:hypothetical protein
LNATHAKNMHALSSTALRSRHSRVDEVGEACAAELARSGHGVIVLADPRGCDRPSQAVSALRRWALNRAHVSSHAHERADDGHAGDGVVTADIGRVNLPRRADSCEIGGDGNNAVVSDEAHDHGEFAHVGMGCNTRERSSGASATVTEEAHTREGGSGATATVTEEAHTREGSSGVTVPKTGVSNEQADARHALRRVDVVANQQKLEWVAVVLADVLLQWAARVGLEDVAGDHGASLHVARHHHNTAEYTVSGEAPGIDVRAAVSKHAGAANAAATADRSTSVAAAGVGDAAVSGCHNNGDEDCDDDDAGAGVGVDTLASLRSQWRRTCRAWRSVSGAATVDYGEANDGLAML